MDLEKHGSSHFSNIGFQNFGNIHTLQLSNEQLELFFYLNAYGDHQV
jgi:hypothetical protein